MKTEIIIRGQVYGEYYTIYRDKKEILYYYEQYKLRNGSLNLLGYLRDQKMLFEREHKAKIDRQKYKEKLTKILFELKDEFNYMSDKDVYNVSKKVVSEILNYQQDERN